MLCFRAQVYINRLKWKGGGVSPGAENKGFSKPRHLQGKTCPGWKTLWFSSF